MMLLNPPLQHVFQPCKLSHCHTLSGSVPQSQDLVCCGIVQAKAKELEIRYAKIIQRRQKLLNFCVSKTQPPIYWLPREPSDELAAQSQDHAAIFEGWKQQQMQQLETEKAALAALIATRKDKSALRLAGGGQHQDEDHEEEQEDGEHQDGAEAATAETVEALEAGVDDPGVLVETAIIDEEDQTGVLMCWSGCLAVLVAHLGMCAFATFPLSMWILLPCSTMHKPAQKTGRGCAL